MDDKNTINYFAETDFRNKKTRFGIKAKDRTKHVYVIGKTGMGKSTLLENMAVQDILNGEGMAFIDPHGELAEKLLEYVPEHRIKDVVYFAPFDTDYPVSFNVMEDVGKDKRHLVANGLMSAFKKLFGEESFSDRMQYILQNTILALLEYPGATMLGINKMLVDKVYRNKVIANITDPSVKTYWTKEYAGYTERFAAEAIPAIQNKIGQFTSNPLIRNIVGQPKSSFDVRKIMDEKKILIMNLSKGRMGEQNSNLLGSMLITKIYLAAMSRADLNSFELSQKPNFYFFVDEFQSFANESFADILSEARKYKLNLTIAHQYIEQMPEEVRAAVFGNIGTMIVFRVGSFDAEIFEKEFAPEFTAEDIVNLGFAQIYLRLMIDGIGSKPFSATTLPPIALSAQSFRNEIIKSSRGSYAKPRAFVEEEITKWHAPAEPERVFQKEFTPKKDELAKSYIAPPAPATRPIPEKTPEKTEERSRHPKYSPRAVSKIADKSQEIETPEQKQKPVSLSALKNTPGAVSQNKVELKKALEEVLKETGNKDKMSAPEVKPEDDAKKRHDGESVAPKTDNSPIKEVPEDVLRKILE